jgi:hypothetical protein
MRRHPGERGFALAVSIFALVIIAALITGVFFAARQEMKIGENSESSLRAFSAANAGLDYAIANWNTSVWNQLATDSTATFSGTLPSGSGSFTGTVERMNPQLFFLRVTGQDKYGLASRTLGDLARLLIMQMTMKGAITTEGQLKIGGSSFIDGVDTNPTGWACDPATDTVPGIATRDSSQIDLSGCTNYSCVEGSPKVASDSTITDTTFSQFGDLNWNDLVSMATKVYPSGYGPASDFAPVGTTTTCDKSVMDNWGDPMSPASVPGCSGYFPIIYVNGDLKATGGYGQGILIVNGDLEVQGGWQFFGPVIVKGTITTQGTGGHFNGGVLAANINLDQDVILGSAVVTYSSCALAKAMQANSPGRLLRQRAFVDLF